MLSMTSVMCYTIYYFIVLLLFVFSASQASSEEKVTFYRFFYYSCDVSLFKFQVGNEMMAQSVVVKTSWQMGKGESYVKLPYINNVVQLVLNLVWSYVWKSLNFRRFDNFQLCHQKSGT